jgi:hypothetical protein
LHNAAVVTNLPRIAIASCLVMSVFVLPATLRARGAGNAVETAAEATALRELLENANGHREAWTDAPELIVLSNVLEYDATDVRSGYLATRELLGADEASALVNDLTTALQIMTDGRLSAFKSVTIEPASAAGERVRVIRRGQIVVARYQGVRAQTGTIGYGVRTARDGVINAAAVILDRDFDETSDRRRLLRTHELGHALGYNHVDAVRSVMNPRVGSDLTDFDRRAARAAFAEPAPFGADEVLTPAAGLPQD